MVNISAISMSPIPRGFTFASFAIGSSWGTFAIMIPIAIPIALALDLPAPLLLGAVLSGSVFGDLA